MAKPMMKKFFYPQKSAGFTLIELLVTIAVGGIIISALLFFVVQLTRTERQEVARSETEREMTMAMDYIESDMAEAVYIYEEECLEDGRGSPTDEDSEYCAGLLNNGLDGVIEDETAVLAFWKLEQLPYSANPTTNENIPPTCTDSDADAECRRVRLRRNSYTLVVYTVSDDLSENWEGPARLVRHQLREFDPENLSSLEKTSNYVSPRDQGYSFASWPCTTQGLGCTMPARNDWTRPATLVDYVDFAEIPAAQECLEPYRPTSSNVLDNTSFSSFYGCVRPATGNTGQDAILFLRGNAIKRAGMSEGTRTADNLPLSSYLPTIQSQVITRSTFDRTID